MDDLDRYLRESMPDLFPAPTRQQVAEAESARRAGFSPDELADEALIGRTIASIRGVAPEPWMLTAGATEEDREEARVEVRLAEAFGYAPPAWATALLATPVPGGGRLIQESRTAAAVNLIESATATAAGEALFNVCLISAGEGSSGIYPADTLKLAADEGVFHAGLHSYIDHPTRSESEERPGRSVKELAGALKSDAVFRDGALWSQLRVFSSHRDFVTERADVVGLSIRAEAESEESYGAKPTITRITRAHSVDVVTKAGRGGFFGGAVA